MSMAGLLDLPDELIIQILHHVAIVEESFENCAAARTKLLLVNKRISSLARAEWTWSGSTCKLVMNTIKESMARLAPYPNWCTPLRNLSVQHPFSSEDAKDWGFDGTIEDFDTLLASLITSAASLQGIILVAMSDMVTAETWEAIHFPATVKSLLESSNLTRLELLGCVDLILALALTEGCLNLQHVGLREEMYFTNIEMVVQQKHMARLWLALARLKSLRILQWDLPSMFSHTHQGIDERALSNTNSIKLSALRTIVVKHEEATAKDGIFWKVACTAFPRVSRFVVDVDQLEPLSKNGNFPLLSNLCITTYTSLEDKHAAPLEWPDYHGNGEGDASVYLDSVVEALSPVYHPLMVCYRKPVFGHTGVASLRVPNLVIAYIAVREDAMFPNLRDLSCGPDRTSAIPRLLDYVAGQCMRRQIELLAETEGELGEADSKEEVDCLALVTSALHL